MSVPEFFDWLEWGVRAEHAEFFRYGFFDDNSLIHSDRTQYTSWTGDCHSIQIHRSEGRARKRALLKNLKSECRISLWGPRQISLITNARTTNRAVIELLWRNDLGAFKSKCEDYHDDDPDG